MKTIKVFFLLGIFLACSVITANAGDINEIIKGTWEVQVPDAPYGYQDYVMTIKTVDDVCKVDITGQNLNIKEQKLTEKEGKLTASIYVGAYVDVTIWEEEDVIKGTADTGSDKLQMIFKKEQKK